MGKTSKKLIATYLTMGLMVSAVNPIWANISNAPTLRPNRVTKSEEAVLVTINNWQEGVRKEYKIGNAEWQSYTGPIVVETNTTVYARSIDESGKSSPVASLKVNNIVKESIGVPAGSIIVSPNGTETGEGTAANPMSLEAAVLKVAPGGIIYLQEGTYSFSTALTIGIDNNGTAEAMKTMVAMDGASVRLDFSSQPYDMKDTSLNERGIQLNGSYWHIKDVEVYGAADNGIFVAGNNNIIEHCILNANRDTGLQISRRTSSLADMKDWPTDNLILNCTSFNNSDPATGENADGFAAKLTCGPGNVFDGCIAYNNVDDGWDLYAKAATGPIGSVTIRNSIAFRNGATTTGEFTKNSDGNGFKLGGSKIANDHYVENCIAFENKNHGFTDNSNPGVITVKNCTSFNNSLDSGAKSNFDFARDKTLSNNILENCIAFSTEKVGSDKYKGTVANSVLMNGGKWYEFKEKAAADTNVTALKGTPTTGPTKADFVSIVSPTMGADVHTEWRNADGTINVGSFLKIADTSAFSGRNLGANLSFGEGVIPTPTIHPTPLPTVVPTMTPTPSVVPTVVPTITPVVSPTPTPEAGALSAYSVEGFGNAVTGGSVLDESSSQYVQVRTAKELGDALRRKSTVKVVEIMNDIDLGWNMIGSEAQTAPITEHNAAKLHPTLLQTGVSKITVDGFDGLTIFSKNGAKITHGAFVFKRCSNVAIRNIEFDEFWEWDEASKGNYDKNDWDFITLEGCKDVWIDHCTFGKAYDGIVDSKVGTSGLTISWSKFNSGEGAFYDAMFDELENNRSSYGMYNAIRNAGLSKAEIMQITAPQKKTHLVGANEQKPDNNDLEITLHHNYYKDSQDRMPRLRGGKAHIYNVVMDARNAYAASLLMSNELVSSLSSKGYNFKVVSNGAISTEGGEVLVENSAILDIIYPIRNNQKDPNKPDYTGKIRALNTKYSLAGNVFVGNSTDENSPLAPVPAPIIETNWVPSYSYQMDSIETVEANLENNVGAGVLSLSSNEWMKTIY